MSDLGKQLDKLIKEKKILIKYPRGYQQWKQKFEKACAETRGDVLKALEKVHGSNYPQGEPDPRPPEVPPLNSPLTDTTK